MEWEPRDDAHWRVELRCGECGHRWETAMPDARAARYDMELDIDRYAIERTLRQLDLERMALEVEGFAIALSHDLIEPADFAT